MLVTLFGIVTLVSALHKENAYVTTLVTPSSIVTEVMLVRCLPHGVPRA